MLIYWANGLFTAAQRSFNAFWARALRDIGHEVILPQEFDVNDPTIDTAALDIFLVDTDAVLKSALVVAVIDDESIDAGVAAEIGITFAAGIPLIGVYTDIRQYRARGRMYKNLYVIGLLEASFGVVGTLDALVERVAAVELSLATNGRRTRALPSDVDFDAFVSGLERSYDPPWSSYAVVADRAARTNTSAIIDIGCGTATLADFIRDPSRMKYIGYDISSDSVERGRKRASIGSVSEGVLTSNLTDLVAVTCDLDPLTSLVVMSFVLHDVRNFEDLRLVTGTMPGARVLIEDLCAGDLPRLTELVCRAAGKPPSQGLSDQRLGMSRIEDLRRAIGFTMTGIEIVTLDCTFQQPSDVIKYCDVFGVFEGHDLPVGGFLSADRLRDSLTRVLSAEPFPFVDRRVFGIVDAILA